jgi:hypothetical protein
MKNKRRILVAVATILAMVLFFSSQIVSQADEKDEPQIVFVEDLFQDKQFVDYVNDLLLAEYGEEYWQNLEQARANDDKLQNFLAHSQAVKTVSTRSASGNSVESQPITSEGVLPDFIGGVYYNDDGNMVLQVVNDEQKKMFAEDVIKNLYSEEDGVICEYVMYSEKELNATMDALNAMYLLPARPVAFNNVDSFALDTIDNNIEVRLLDNSVEAVQQFKSTVLDSAMVEFVKCENRFTKFACETTTATTTTRPPAPQVTMNPGTSNYMGGSVGYRAKLANGSVGFVTHGHTLYKGKSLVIGDNTYGTITKWNDGENVDASFVQTDSKVTLSNSYSGGSFSTTVRTSFSVGDNILKVGVATGVTVGKIKNVSLSFANLTDQVGTDLSAGPGDSGGICVWVQYPLTNPHQTAGVLVGGDATYSMVFTKASRINALFGLSRY